jgi:hypothetical protein
MAPSDPVRQYAPDPNILERRACAYLKQLNAVEERDQRERHPEEVAALRSIERRAVMYAAAAGIVSGGIIGGGEVVVRQVWIGDAEAGWLDHWRIWLAFFAFAGVISAVEIAFLYWNALRAIARLTRLSGVSLGGRAHAEVVSRGLARAGLEFPNPRDRIYGIDPYAHVSNWRLTVENLLYKLKVGVSSFLLRLFLRRVLGRMMVRGLVPLIAGPLYAVWNALITWRISREARVRALGPFVIGNLVEEVKRQRDSLSRPARHAMLQGAGELMMRGRDGHPNYVVLLSQLRAALDIEEESRKVDWEEARRVLPALGETERSLVVGVLTLAAMLGNKVRRAQRELLEEACGDCGSGLDEQAFARLRTKLIEGRMIAYSDLNGAVQVKQEVKDSGGRDERR